eukprot:6699763-Alexandrium_andersonii.AAC.1
MSPWLRRAVLGFRRLLQKVGSPRPRSGRIRGRDRISNRSEKGIRPSPRCTALTTVHSLCALHAQNEHCGVSSAGRVG